MSEIKQLTKRIKNANRQTERPGPLLQRPPEDAHHQKAANDRNLGRDQRDRVSSFRSSSERNRPGKNRKNSVRNLEKRTGEKKWIKEQWLVLEKKLTKTQQEIIKFSRYIIYYCEHGYVVDCRFESLQHLIQIATYISHYGDIATVRRALKLLSYDKKINPPIVAKISKRVQQEIEDKKKVKYDCMNSLKIKKGPVVVVFD